MPWACLPAAESQQLFIFVGLQTVEAKQQERIWRSRAATAEATLQQMQQDMAEIVADMKRQHEAALQATQQRMQQLEAREAELLRLMEGKEAAVKELAAKHSDTCKDRDAQASNPPPTHARLPPENICHFSIAAIDYRPGAVVGCALPAWVYPRVDCLPPLGLFADPDVSLLDATETIQPVLQCPAMVSIHLSGCTTYLSVCLPPAAAHQICRLPPTSGGWKRCSWSLQPCSRQPLRGCMAA